jgi:hypothetical protein
VGRLLQRRNQRKTGRAPDIPDMPGLGARLWDFAEHPLALTAFSVLASESAGYTYALLAVCGVLVAAALYRAKIVYGQWWKFNALEFLLICVVAAGTGYILRQKTVPEHGLQLGDVLPPADKVDTERSQLLNDTHELTHEVQSCRMDLSKLAEHCAAPGNVDRRTSIDRNTRRMWIEEHGPRVNSVPTRFFAGGGSMLPIFISHQIKHL